MAYGTKALVDPIRELAFGGISGTFAVIGTPLTVHARVIRFANSTNADIYISFDGINNNIRLAASSFILFDFATNRIQDDGLFVSIGTQFWAKQVSAPSSGTVWIEVVSGTGGV